jgi:hypothetical protein
MVAARVPAQAVLRFRIAAAVAVDTLPVAVVDMLAVVAADMPVVAVADRTAAAVVVTGNR